MHNYWAVMYFDQHTVGYGFNTMQFRSDEEKCVSTTMHTCDISVVKYRFSYLVMILLMYCRKRDWFICQRWRLKLRLQL